MNTQACPGPQQLPAMVVSIVTLAVSISSGSRDGVWLLDRHSEGRPCTEDMMSSIPGNQQWDLRHLGNTYGRDRHYAFR